jgi:sugar phosphate isomerase/epimerase
MCAGLRPSWPDGEIGTAGCSVIGDGTINWAGLLADLYDLRFNGTFILEINGIGDRKSILEGARRGRSFLRDLSHRLRVSG